MASTLADLEVRLLHKLALPSSDQMVQAVDLDMSINNGLNASATDYDWPWLMQSANIVTIAGTAIYALPVDHVRTLWIANTALGGDLIARQRREMTKWYATNAATSAPSYYSVYGAAVRLAPVPNDVYVLSQTYIRREPPLVISTDTPLCPDWFSEVIVLYAAIEEATRTKDFMQRNAYLADLAAWKHRMVDNVRQEASTLRIRARSDW